MALFNWFRRKTPLQLALQRGVESGDLAHEIAQLGEIVLANDDDAEALCAVLEELVAGRVHDSEGEGETALHALAGLFQNVESTDCGAYPVLLLKGLPLLREAARQAAGTGDEEPADADAVLFAMKILALFGTREGAEFVVEMARRALEPDSWLWNVILGAYRDGHPEARYVFAELGEPLPIGFIGISLLDAANRFFLEGGEARHPFDSDAGVARLRGWLLDPDPENYSYAISTVAALPFLLHPAQAELLQTATWHPSPEVRLESAWAAAKVDSEDGFAALIEMAGDVNLSSRACDYLRELKRADAIPALALSPEFAARAEFVQWLSHPNELGRVPDELSIYDQRTLRWPPDFEPIPVWLLRYGIRDRTGLEHDDEGVGMVGSTTWSLFSSRMEERPPEDGYALHCLFELGSKEVELHEIESGSTEYDGLLAQWAGPPVADLRLLLVAELDEELRHPRKLVALALGTMREAPGWLVLDGPASHWYPEADFPAGESAETVLKIHLGRSLLGFPPAEGRRAYLRPREPISDARVVAAYERSLQGAASLRDAERMHLFTDSDSLLARHFSTYVAAASRERSQLPAEVTVLTYEALIQGAEALAPGTPLEKAFDSFTPVGANFEAYVAALLELHRAPELLAFTRRLIPLWEHNLGYGKLGSAAFQAGDFVLAESLLLRLREGWARWPGCDEVAYLAEIWQARGEGERAHDLLVQALHYILGEAARATGTDIEFHERIYQRRRADFSRLCGGEGALAALRLPETSESGGG